MKTNDKILEEFYALTAVGVWRVSAKRYGMSVPIVELIAHHADSALPIIGSRLQGGNTVTVAGNFVGLHFQSVPFCAKRETIKLKLPETISPDDLGETTPKLIACFLNLEDALKANEMADISLAEAICEDNTLEVLRRIGPNHPVFVVCRGGNLGFPIWFYGKIGIDRNSVPEVRVKLLDFGKEKEKVAVEVPIIVQRAIVPTSPIRPIQKPTAPVKAPAKPIAANGNLGAMTPGIVAPPVQTISIQTRTKVSVTPIISGPIFLEIFSERTVKIIKGDEFETEKLPIGKYEMAAVKVDRGSETYLSGEWWIIKSRLPDIVGHTRQFWECWIYPAMVDFRYLVHKTTS